ncbi:ABC transporter ATP-binding protein [Rubrimonas cliftonensis]|uniref:ABC-2 type transport system ATP-binding protein n=1 Tax=Rubrimonas cliftonensis TaxID=89524 RepID=A0A1H4F9N7_9RHOB|nr:ABC transporter ATP-binding protein [Rubrimonas cliftonensis]SEA93627.1 ABC-2 type transport system ATP-binding protein [Rubrimonas cliftonensis]
MSDRHEPADAISVRGLRKTYRGAGGAEVEALRGVDLTVPSGSIFGLLGPNGAGKSTFINILAGLVVKSAGSVRIWGFDQDANPRMSRASIGVVPQELNTDPFFTPREALEAQAGLYGVPKSRRRSDEILAALGLADKAHAYARSLSGGMKRRLLVAKALAHDPAVLVLDEPTAGVDIELRRSLWSYVRELNARGVTIILTTHYLEEAQEMCDRIAIIDKGRVAACEDTPALLSRLQDKTLVIHPETPLAAAPAGLDGLRATLRPNGDLALPYARGADDPLDLVARAQAAGVMVRDISTEEPDLEDVFLALTGDRAA